MYMNSTKENKIYSLYLSSIISLPQSVPINKTKLGNITWNVDWNNLFRGNQNLYKNCRVRYSLKSARSSLVYLNNIGVLTCSLSSNYNANTTPSTVLGLLKPKTCPDTTETGAIYDNSTIDEIGIDINIPSSSSYFTLSFLKYSDLSIMSSVTDYEIILYFELY